MPYRIPSSTSRASGTTMPYRSRNALESSEVNGATAPGFGETSAYGRLEGGTPLVLRLSPARPRRAP